jgi:hypothetical protein
MKGQQNDVDSKWQRLWHALVLRREEHLGTGPGWCVVNTVK